MSLTRKPFAEFAAELAAGLAAGRDDEPIAESAVFKVIEVAPRAHLILPLVCLQRFAADIS